MKKNSEILIEEFDRTPPDLGYYTFPEWMIGDGDILTLDWFRIIDGETDRQIAEVKFKPINMMFGDRLTLKIDFRFPGDDGGGDFISDEEFLNFGDLDEE